MCTITSSSDLSYFDNWSPQFHCRFTEFKELVKSDRQTAIKTITGQLELSKLIPNASTIAGKKNGEPAFGSTVINQAIAIVQQTKPFDDYRPALLVALLYILELVVDKKVLLNKRQGLMDELDQLDQLLGKLL